MGNSTKHTEPDQLYYCDRRYSRNKRLSCEFSFSVWLSQPMQCHKASISVVQRNQQLVSAWACLLILLVLTPPHLRTRELAQHSLTVQVGRLVGEYHREESLGDNNVAVYLHMNNVGTLLAEKIWKVEVLLIQDSRTQKRGRMLFLLE